MLTKAKAKSLLIRMGFVKRKGSTSAKLPVAEFEKQKEQYLSDIRTEVIMNDIPPSLIINWDQTAIHLVPVSGWTVNMQGEKSIPIAGLDDKREVMVVLAVTMAGEYFPPQILYQGKTEICHPAIEFPPEWNVWHSEDHSLGLRRLFRNNFRNNRAFPHENNCRIVGLIFVPHV